MGTVETVRIGDVEFFVETTESAGPQNVGLGEPFSFDEVRDTVKAIGVELAQALRETTMHEASVEFGLSMSAKAGKLTGLLVDGHGAASFKVTLT